MRSPSIEVNVEVAPKPVRRRWGRFILKSLLNLLLIVLIIAAALATVAPAYFSPADEQPPPRPKRSFWR